MFYFLRYFISPQILIFTTTTAFSLICLVAVNLKPVNSYITSVAQHYELKGSPRPLGSIWPRPQLNFPHTTVFTVATSKFEIELLDATQKAKHKKDVKLHCPLLDWALGHYTKQVRRLHGNKYQYQAQPSNPNDNNSNDWNSTTTLHRKEKSKSHSHSRSNGAYKLQIYLHECIDYPQDYTTQYEKYYITSKYHGPLIDEVVAVVDANSAQSVIRALESLYQMLWPVEYEDGRFEYFINSTEITDFPRFVHRGLMLDTSRHFLPERTIVKILTGMMYNKLNVFHWHIVDDQSFPFESQVFPELSKKGAYHKNAVYTPEIVQRIIEAARVRGIRVIFEFDTPGHAGGIRKSHQELLTPCYGDGKNPGTSNSHFGTYENLDPSNEEMYDFMRELFTEIIQNVTKDAYVHLGMDEVNAACWESSPQIRRFMEAHGFTEVKQVQEYYTTRHVTMVKSLGAKMISWQDPLDDGVQLDKEVVIHVWKDWNTRGFENTYKRILSAGYKVLLSSCWYLNYINYGESWRAYYNCDPYLNGQISKSHRNQVLGGEAAIWGEYVDSTNIMPRLFPFIGGAGYALWDSNIDTPIGRENVDDAMFRLDAFRCSMLQRGIQAQPIYNGHCGSYETEVDVDFNK